MGKIMWDAKKGLLPLFCIGIVVIVFFGLFIRYITAVGYFNRRLYQEKIDAVNSKYMNMERQKAFEVLQKAIDAMPDSASPDWAKTSDISPEVYEQQQDWKRGWSECFSLVKKAREYSPSLYLPYSIVDKREGLEVRTRIRARNLSNALAAEALRQAAAGNIQELIEYAELSFWISEGLRRSLSSGIIMSAGSRSHVIRILFLKAFDSHTNLTDIARMRHLAETWYYQDILPDDWWNELRELEVVQSASPTHDLGSVREGTIREKLWLAIWGASRFRKDLDDIWLHLMEWSDASWPEYLEKRQIDSLPEPRWLRGHWEYTEAKVTGGPKKEWVIHKMDYLMFSRYTDRARFVLLDATLAVEEFLRTEGKLPESLEDLVPGYSGNVFVDPFSGEGLIYRKSDNGYVIYSVGPNGIDNGGIIENDEILAMREVRWYEKSKDFVVQRPKIDF